MNDTFAAVLFANIGAVAIGAFAIAWIGKKAGFGNAWLISYSVLGLASALGLLNMFTGTGDDFAFFLIFLPAPFVTLGAVILAIKSWPILDRDRQ